MGLRFRFRVLTATALVVFPAVAITAQRGPDVRQAGDRRADSAAAGAVALTIEGGGSLGAYEGGMTWALVETFRARRALPSDAAPLNDPIARLPRLDLVASAGASAGSVNALLASVSWCTDSDSRPAEQSPFWTAWVSTGISELSPTPRTAGWAERGVFSRDHFRNFVMPSVHRDWQEGGARAVRGCEVAFGASVTRFDPDSVEVAKGLYARNQRFGAAALVRPPEPGGDGPRFFQPPRATQSFGPTGYQLLLPERNGVIARADVEQLVMASSAFPLAFEPVSLPFCRATPTCGTPEHGDFLDGSVFDNGPLALAYDLTHAVEPPRSGRELYLLYLSADRRRRLADGRRDIFRARSPDDSAHHRRPEGLDAGFTVVSNFVPAARAYELQLAARVLPQAATVEQALAMKDAELAAADENVRRALARADSEHAVHTRANAERDSAWARALAGESAARQRAQVATATCRLRPAECGAATALDSMLADWSADFAAVPAGAPMSDVREPAPVVPATVDSVRGGSFAHAFYVSTRWHPLAGEWLTNFGAFLGQPLREYDFWVGVYDALSMVAGDAICGSDPATATDPRCRMRTLRELIDRPPFPMSASGKLALHTLFSGEFVHATTDSAAASVAMVDRALLTPRTPHDVVLAAVIDAMQSRMQWPDVRAPECRSGSYVERSVCSQGIEAFFGALRRNDAVMDALERSADACERAAPLADGCFADERFLRLVRQPGPELDRISEFVLHRLDETTPMEGRSKPFVLLANAAYYSTNESMRSGWDLGSSSLPSSLYAAACDSFTVAHPKIRHLRRCSQRVLRFYPSSVGVPFFPHSAQYAEWTLRYNRPGGWAVGGVLRLMTSNGRHVGAGRSPRMIEVPGVRAEWKTSSLLIPTIGADIGWWLDSSHPLFGQPDAARLAYGGTFTALAGKLRFSLTRIPDGYRAGGSQKWMWTGGLGDVNGMLYWLWRITTE
jgi:predicted acylesterase/phospholipase RssA